MSANNSIKNIKTKLPSCLLSMLLAHHNAKQSWNLPRSAAPPHGRNQTRLVGPGLAPAKADASVGPTSFAKCLLKKQDFTAFSRRVDIMA
jgi:hypothetical protein